MLPLEIPNNKKSKEHYVINLRDNSTQNTLKY